MAKRKNRFKSAYMAVADKQLVPLGNGAQELESAYGKMSLEEAIVLAMALKAINGDLQAATFLRDTIGEKPDGKATLQSSDGQLKIKIEEA